MTIWLIASNLKTYDSIAAFSELGELYWNEKQVQFEQGDVVYIYIASPISAIGIKCAVEDTRIEKPDIDDSQYWLDEDEYAESLKKCTWMRLRCITIFSEAQRNKLKGKVLKDHGLKSGFVLSRQRASDELLDYIECVESGS